MTDTLAIVAIVVLLMACVVFAGVAAVLWRGRSPVRAEAADMARLQSEALARQQSEAMARLQGMIGLLQQGQSQLQRAVNERLEVVSHRLGDSLEKTKQSTTENLQKLNERLAVIDSAQKNITDLATQVTSLQAVLSNKQSRGAFGQGRMETIVKDSLPMGAYAFQHTL